MQVTRTRRLHIFAMALIPLAAAPLAQADVLILQSSVKGLAANTVLIDGATVTVPDGDVVVLMVPSGETLKITGPASRPVEELASGQADSDAYKAGVSAAKDALALQRSGEHAGQVAGGDATRIFCEELESLFAARGCTETCAGKCASWVQRHNAACAEHTSLACGSN